MKNAIIIFFFTLSITLFYNYVGQLVPQKEVQPPKSAEIRPGMSSEEMVAAGEILVEGKGTCTNCHNGNRRFPLFDNLGAVAGTRRDGYSDVEYLAEALYEPNKYILEPFAPGMPAVGKPPISLNDQEILCVIAYLQSQGGTPSVTLETKLKYQGQGGVAAVAAAKEDDKAKEEKLNGKGLVAKYGCLACHSVDAPVRMVGPALNDLGSRMSKGEIYEALIDPDATIAKGEPAYPGSVMGATLGGNGFFTDISPQQLKLMVDYLASLKG